MPRKTLAQALGITDRQLKRLESGEKELSREGLVAAIAPLHHPPEAAEALLFTHQIVAGRSTAEEDSPVTLSEAQELRANRAALAVGWAVAEATRAALVLRQKSRVVAAAQREAETLCARLKSASAAERKAMVATFPEYRSWALAVALSHASERAAAHSATLAVDLARLALVLASRIKGAGRFRARLVGYCSAYLANALRVANKFADADAAFRRARDLWESGADPDQLLEGWRLFDLEASLRRAQHRFAQALDLLKKAGELTHNDRALTARLLLKKQNVLVRMGDFEAALATAQEAAPLLEEPDDVHLIFTLRYNIAADLCHLERFQEAHDLLPRVRDLAEQLRNDLDLLRVVWLEARVAGGLGGREKAVSLLDQVRGDFTALHLPYDAALSSLDLSVLFLEAGQTRKVRELAVAMAWIFTAQGIEREALAALTLFCQAATSETATVELARKVIAEIEAVRRSHS
jgi:tetratricopeptide (TPR) repeat protein